MRTAAILLIALVLLLAGCASCPPSCSDGVYCTKDTCGESTDHECVHTPIAGCDEAAEEARAACTGKSQASPLLEKVWDEKSKTCVVDIPAGKQATRTLTQEASAGGDRFTIQAQFRTPFNLGKDTFDITIGFKSAAASTADHRFKRLTLTARTPDKRVITIADAAINTPLFNTPASKVFETLVLDVPEDGAQGTLDELTLTAQYEYTSVSGTTRTPKTGTTKTVLRNEDLIWTRPSAQYPCPQCPPRAGHRSDCGAHTEYFCQYLPEADACGNFACESGENTCTCPQDCGPCAGNTPNLEFSCVQEGCKGRLRASYAPAQKTDVEDRDLGPLTLHNAYEYVTPFNIDTDAIVARFEIFEKADDISRMRIQSIRVLEGAQQLAQADPNVFIPPKGSSEQVRITIPPTALTAAEQQKTLTLNVVYTYRRGDTDEKGSWNKQLRERITLVNPDE